MVFAQTSVRRHRRIFLLSGLVALLACSAARGQPAPGPGFRFGGPNGNGDPTDGRDPLDELVQPLANLNLRPHFALTDDQKDRVEAIRHAFAARMAGWRKDHAADFAALAKDWGDLRAGGPGRAGGGGFAAFGAVRDRQQRLLATAPDPSDAQAQIEAVLTDEQRGRYEAATSGDAAASAPAGTTRPAAFGAAVLPVPADGVPKLPGFYKLRVTAKVPADGGGTRNLRMTYVLFLPQSYAPAKGPYPTLVFLHGSGEVGTDGNGIFAAGLGPAATIRSRAGSAFAREFPMILVCPQCPPHGERWDQTPVLRAALQVLDDAAAKVKVDPDRVYVTGLSMGGKGAWLLAGEAPDRLAGLVPFSSSTLDLPLARRLRNLSVWAIDGAEDYEDGPDHNRQMIQAAHDAGGDATVTIVPHQGHFVWGDYYGDPKFYRWFLARHRLTAAERAARVPPATQPTGGSGVEPPPRK